MTSVCKACMFPSALPACIPDEYCDLVKLCGVLNITDVQAISSDPEEPVPESVPTTLYAYRIEVANCTDSMLCNAMLSLRLKWKYNNNTVFQNFISGLNSSLGMYMNGAGILNNQGVYLIRSNIPDAQVVFANGDWDGEPADAINLFTEPFDLPVGKWLVEVFFSIPTAFLEGLTDDHGLPTLFPAEATLRVQAMDNLSCPRTFTALIGCSPTQAVIGEQT